METLHELLVRRHSIRRYTDAPVDAEDVKTILEAALMAPSSKSARPWHFVLVDDPETLRSLSECKPQYAVSLKKCPLAVVVCADPERSDMFIEDTSIAAAFMQLQAAALGLGSCWVQVRGRYQTDDEDSQDVVRRILGIPANIVVECIVTIGHPDEERRPVDTSKLLWEKVHVEKWNPDQE